MSVESCTPSTHKATGSGHGTSGKSRTAGEATADASGFSALLLQLGANDADVTAGEQDEQVPLVPELAMDEKPVVDDAQVDPALLLAQSAQFQQSPQPVAPALLLAQSMQFQQGLKSADPAVVTIPEGGLAAAVGSVPTDAVPPPTLPEGAASTQAAKGVGVMRPELGEAAKEAVTKAPVQQRGTQRAVVTEIAATQQSSVATNAHAAAETRMHKLAQVEPRTEATPGQAQTLAISGLSEVGVRRAERVGEKMASGQGGSSEGAWGHQALLATGSVEPSFTMAEPAAVMSPEAMVAEQVNYWIGHDVQNAELKLDGMGDSPVEVSISLQGNEARVEFRTDQLETRQVLEGAVSQLKDLLGNEGLVLSGVSIGSSGAESSPSQERRERQNSRQAAVVVPELKSVDMNARPARVSDRSVDLFV